MSKYQTIKSSIPKTVTNRYKSVVKRIITFGSFPLSIASVYFIFFSNTTPSVSYYDNRTNNTIKNEIRPPNLPPFLYSTEKPLIISKLPVDLNNFPSYLDCLEVSNEKNTLIQPVPPEASTLQPSDQTSKICYYDKLQNKMIFTSFVESRSVSSTFQETFINSIKKECDLSNIQCYFRSSGYFNPRPPPTPNLPPPVVETSTNSLSINSNSIYNIVSPNITFDSYENAYNYCNIHYNGIASPYNAFIMNEMYQRAEDSISYIIGYRLKVLRDGSLVYGGHTPVKNDGILVVLNTSEYSTDIVQNKTENIKLPTHALDIYDDTLVNLFLNSKYFNDLVVDYEKDANITLFETNKSIKKIIFTNRVNNSKTFCYRSNVKLENTTIKGFIKNWFDCECKTDENCCPIWNSDNSYTHDCKKDVNIIFDPSINSFRKCSGMTDSQNCTSKICQNTCVTSETSNSLVRNYFSTLHKSNKNGRCEDGGEYTLYSDDEKLCEIGHDCNDCGPRCIDPSSISPPNYPPPSSVPCTVVCLNTCDNKNTFINDGVCDDGGPGYEFDSCTLGTDCADCGNRCINEKYSPPPPRPLPPPPPLLSHKCNYVCNNNCSRKVDILNYNNTNNGFSINETQVKNVTNDGYCDENVQGVSQVLRNVSGVLYKITKNEPACLKGSDCNDCDPYCDYYPPSTPLASQPFSPPSPSLPCLGTFLCENDCLGYVNDGVCDDGDYGSLTSRCSKGRDCFDCGVRCNSERQCVSFSFFNESNGTLPKGWEIDYEQSSENAVVTNGSFKNDKLEFTNVNARDNSNIFQGNYMKISNSASSNPFVYFVSGEFIIPKSTKYLNLRGSFYKNEQVHPRVSSKGLDIGFLQNNEFSNTTKISTYKNLSMILLDFSNIQNFDIPAKLFMTFNTTNTQNFYIVFDKIEFLNSNFETLTTPYDRC